MKFKKEHIVPLCAYCIHATFVVGTNDEPSLLTTLHAHPQRDNTKIRCRYHKESSADFSCRRFSFDPLKYRPCIPPGTTQLDEDSLWID